MGRRLRSVWFCILLTSPHLFLLQKHFSPCYSLTMVLYPGFNESSFNGIYHLASVNLFSANLLFAAIGASGKMWNKFDLDGNYCKSLNPPCNLFTRQLQHWLRTLCSRSRKLRSAGKTALGLTDQNPGKNFYNLKVSGCHWQDDDIEESESFGIKNWSKSKRKTDWKWKSNGKLRFNKSILGLD